MTNLFDNAKKKSTTKKTENHEIVDIPKIEKAALKVIELNEKIAELEAERETADSEIREAGKEAMIKLYDERKKFPGTLKIIAGSANFQFITSDRYKKIDEDRFEELSETYGEKIVEEQTKFSFNTAILMKHMEHISKLLMNSKVLSDAEKENLMESETAHTVKKGVINDLLSFITPIMKKTGVHKTLGLIENIIEDIQPVFSIKSVQKDS